MKWLKKVAATPLTSIARVVDSLQEQTNDRTNAPSVHAVREAVNNNWLSIYPIGSIYLTVDPTFDPSITFGGTWEQIKDRFLLASGDTYTSGNTGGSAKHTPSGTVGNHTLTINEIPSHSHTYEKNGTQGSAYQTTTIGMAVAEYSSSTPNTGSAGGGQGHNHGFTGTEADTMPPYLVVNVWKRTA